MKKLCFFLFLFNLSLIAVCACCESLDESILHVTNELDLSGLPALFSNLLGDEDEIRSFIARLASGREIADMEAVFSKLLESAMSTLNKTFAGMIRLFLPAFLMGVTSRIQPSLSGSKSFRMAEHACFLSIAAVMAWDLKNHLTLCESTITRMANAMQALFPLLLTLLTAIGGAAGAACYQPALTAAGGTMITFIRSFTLRIALLHGAMTILHHLSDAMDLSRLCTLLRRLAAWTLGVAFTLFLSVTTLQGISGSIRDGISIRTMKYAVNNFVPVVGGMFADTMDTLIGSGLLVKNALGITGLVGLVLLSAGPLLETLCASFVYRLCGALLELIAPKRLCACMDHFASVLTLFFVIELSVGAMFFLLAAQLLAAGNLIVMLR